MRATFKEGQPLSEVANLRQGLATADNNRFLREWWEVAIPRIAFACTSREAAARSGARWFPYNKGAIFESGTATKSSSSTGKTTEKRFALSELKMGVALDHDRRTRTSIFHQREIQG